MKIILCSDDEVDSWLNKDSRSLAKAISAAASHGIKNESSPADMFDDVESRDETGDAELTKINEDACREEVKRIEKKLGNYRLYITTGTNFYSVGIEYVAGMRIEDGDEKFTQEERDYLAEKHQALIHKCALERTPVGASQAYATKILEACYEGYVKALNKFNKRTSSVPFINYAIAAMKHAVIDASRKEASERKLNVVPLDDQDKKEEDGDIRQKFTEQEGEKEDEKSETKALRDVFFSKVFKCLSDDELRFVEEFYMNDMTLVELAGKYRVSISAMGKMKKNVIEKLQWAAQAYGFEAKDFFN